jgi:biopolymer transport protein TolQ
VKSGDVTGMYDGWSFLAEMWRNVSPLVECSLLLLMSMFLWVLLESIERTVIYVAAMRQSRSFLKRAPGLLENSDWNGVLALAAARKRSHVAMVFASGLRAFCSARVLVSPERSIDIGKRTAQIETNSVRELLRQGLNTLGTIATTAPLVGFFGTIIGICDSFRGGSGTPAMWLALTANSIAEALVCTAAGILVAVPTVWCFNWRRDLLSALDAEMEITYLELVKFLEQQSLAGKL